jgi:hypothetical protein
MFGGGLAAPRQNGVAGDPYGEVRPPLSFFFFIKKIKNILIKIKMVHLTLINLSYQKIDAREFISIFIDSRVFFSKKKKKTYGVFNFGVLTPLN